MVTEGRRDKGKRRDEEANHESKSQDKVADRDDGDGGDVHVPALLHQLLGALLVGEVNQRDGDRHKLIERVMAARPEELRGDEVHDGDERVDAHAPLGVDAQDGGRDVEQALEESHRDCAEHERIGSPRKERGELLVGVVVAVRRAGGCW
jgi:hypothetical protein